MSQLTSNPVSERLEPQVHVKAGQCRISAEITHQLLCQLEKRLDAVLQPINPEETGVVIKGEQLVPFASTLANIDSMQQAANSRLESILDRLEL